MELFRPTEEQAFALFPVGPELPEEVRLASEKHKAFKRYVKNELHKRLDRDALNKLIDEIKDYDRQLNNSVGGWGFDTVNDFRWELREAKDLARERELIPVGSVKGSFTVANGTLVRNEQREEV